MHFDLTPYYKSTVGFDRIFSLLDSLNGVESDNGYPPYNIERVSDDEYRISMAVAGFGEDDLSIEVKENALTVSGSKSDSETDQSAQVLHRGIATRAFERRFRLADFVEVLGAKLENGLLHIDLKREVPETMKPRTIEISSSAKKTKSIEQKAA